jgi:protein-disulfide isomerase
MSSRVRQKQANRIVREQLARERRRRRTMVVSIIAVCAVVVAGLVGLTVYEVQKPKGSAATPAHTTPDKAGILVSSGTVTVEVYLDYLCPNCKKFEDAAASTMDQLVKDGKIRLVDRPIAILDQSTNPSGYSTRAGSAAGCAADGGKFAEYSKALYAQQPAEGSAGLTDDQLVQIGAGVGLTDPSFAQCVRSGRYASWMARNTDAAAGNHIQGTPTVLVAGKEIEASADALTAAVNAAAK